MPGEGVVINGNISMRDDAKKHEMHEELESYLHHLYTLAALVFKCDICQGACESDMLFVMHVVHEHVGGSSSMIGFPLVIFVTA